MTVSKPDGYDEYLAANPHTFDATPTATEEQKWKFLTAILHNKKMKENNAYAAKVSKATIEYYERTQQDLSIEASTIYNEGRFIAECRKEFSKQWLNDTYVLDFILLMGASLRVLNAYEGIHLHISGDTQSGKSAGAKTALKFLPNDMAMTKSFTPKAIFYGAKKGLIHPKMIVFCDDVTQDKEVAEVYRNILTSWDTGVGRLTVNKGDAEEISVPARVSLIMTNVDSVARETDDGQDESRYLTIEVRRTMEELEQIFKFVQMDMKNFDKSQMDMLRMVWDIMPMDIEIKLHRKFPFQGTMRESKRYLTMIQSHALLCGRDTTQESDVDEVDKLLTYSKKMVNSNTAPLTRKEQALLATLTQEWEPVNDVAARLKVTRENLYRAIRGRDGSFDNPTGGLIMKEPRFEFKTQSSDDEVLQRMVRLRR
jgi:hypothetical protein